MRLAEWFRPPRHVLTVFIGLALVSALALGWLAWLLLERDVALEAQRRQERLEQVADRAAALMQSELSDLELRLSSALAGSPSLPPGVLFLVAGPGATAVYPPGGLLYRPVLEATPEPPAAPFVDGERLEFAQGDLAAAAERYAALTSAADQPVRAGALVRLGRVRRKQRRWDEALATYDALSGISGVRLGGLPPGVVARAGRAGVLEDAGRSAALIEEAVMLDADLRGGRWPLTKAQYQFYAGAARRWMQRSGSEAAREDAERLALAEAVGWLWNERPWDRGPVPDAASRRLVQIGDGPVLLIWRVSADSVRLGVAGARYLGSLARRAIPDGDVELTLSDPDGHLVLGGAGSSRPTAFRPAASTGLPWNVQLAATPDGLPVASARRGLLLWVLTLVGVVWLTGAFFIGRAISRELAVDRLQSDFVAAVSHEFRSPLSSLCQVAEMLVSDRLVSEQLRRRAYDVLARETDRLRRLVERLLDFGRFESGAAVYHFESLELASFLEATVADFAPTAAASGHTVDLRLPAGRTCVRGDREALSRVVWNLLENAAKYSPDARVVWLEAERVGEHVSIAVRDHGLGIPPEEQRAVFERFVRGAGSKARRIKGTGVGLAMVRRIVDAHGGEIRLTSHPGQGSCFTVILKSTSAVETSEGVA